MTHVSHSVTTHNMLYLKIDMGGRSVFCQKVFTLSDNCFGGVVGGSADEPTWRMAKRCDSGACVEIGTLGESVLVRSSADADDIIVTLSGEKWREFAGRVKDGDFDGL